MGKTCRTFHIYRFQIVPRFKEEEQLELLNAWPGVKTRTDLIRKKNEIFASVLKGLKQFEYRQTELTHQYSRVHGFLVIKLGAERGLVRIRRDFERETLDTWPSAYIVINNDPHVQKIAIEYAEEAFLHTGTIARILATTLDDALAPYGLTIEILPLFVKKEFWDLVQLHQAEITKAQFYIGAPNLGPISKSLERTLRKINKTTNSKQTTMTLQAPQGEYLTLAETNALVNSLVHYSSQGGGTVHLWVGGVRKVLKTEDSPRSVELDEHVFAAKNPGPKMVAGLADELCKPV